jgi:hypothetical protein
MATCLSQKQRIATHPDITTSIKCGVPLGEQPRSAHNPTKKHCARYGQTVNGSSLYKDRAAEDDVLGVIPERTKTLGSIQHHEYSNPIVKKCSGEGHAVGAVYSTDPAVTDGKSDGCKLT